MPRAAEQLTTESLARFVGGEAEIQNEGEGYLFRGEIAEAKVEGNSLILKFAWCAKNRGGPFGDGGAPSPDWDNDPTLDYSASLEIYHHSDIGNGRMIFQSPIVGELTTLFPAHGSKMNPESIHGFPEQFKAAQMEKWQVWNDSR
jgi:hypothetical protein